LLDTVGNVDLEASAIDRLEFEPQGMLLEAIVSNVMGNEKRKNVEQIKPADTERPERMRRKVITCIMSQAIGMK